MANKALYHLKPSAYFYIYSIERACGLSLEFPKGLYTRAYSLKQAIIYFKRKLAEYNLVRPYDIDIDPNDIEFIGY